MKTTKPALFLDRDGVIIENRAHYVRSWHDVVFLPGALSALARTASLPMFVFVVTNQSMIGRGIVSLETAVSLNNRILNVVRAHGGRIDQAFICPHAPEEDCTCRKPKPGLLQQAAAAFPVDMANSIMIGDALSDLQAGQAAGVGTTALLLTGRGKAQNKLAAAEGLRPFPIYPNLQTALQQLIKIENL
ncbi:MAG: D-glycero-beta-D-manno-heptose 1,7-bisphosphate 7-phosphatase [Candidatus Promineifilaceae bacterium]